MAEAEQLIQKVETAPASAFSADIKQMKLDLAKVGSLLKSQLKTAQRYGL